jgi:lipid-A-disaccharide synthase
VETWWDARELAVMGLFEVLSHFPRLLKLRRELKRRLLELQPDVFIGIDAPDFNLGLEIKLRRAGIRTVHYVSPTVWAWREKRVRKIARAADLVLCLFPFEPEFYRDHEVPATYVGHSLADQVEPDENPAAARSRLGLDPDARTVALLPGSRHGEVSRLAEPMIEAKRILSGRHDDIQFTAAMVNEHVEEQFRSEMQRLAVSDIQLVRNDPRTVIAAADLVLCASGTATLEVMLVNRPLVMTYRIAQSTYKIGYFFNLMKLKWFSLPNILAGEELIPELIQDHATAENLAEAAEKWLGDEQAVAALKVRFRELHQSLRCNAASKAADAVAELLDHTPG